MNIAWPIFFFSRKLVQSRWALLMGKKPLNSWHCSRNRCLTNCPSFHFPEIHVHFYLPTYPHKYRRILWPSGNHLRNFLSVKRDYIFDNLYEGRRTINIEKVRQYGEQDPKFLWWALRNPGFVKVLFKVTKRSRGSNCQIIRYNA